MELIGNADIVSQLRIAIISAGVENRSLPHMIFCGAPGCGKTSMAKKIAELTGNNLLVVAADSLKARDDVVDLMSKFNREGHKVIKDELVPEGKIKPTLVFIDEIHNLSLAAQENLGILMEEWYIPVDAKKASIAPAKRFEMSIVESQKSFLRRYLPIAKIKPKEEYKRLCPRFTLIGATTNDGKLSKPFRDRFKLRFNFSTYSFNESIQILKVHAERLKIHITDDALIAIANRGRGVPRILVGLLERCRDAAVMHNLSEISREVTIMIFALCGIDRDGLTTTDIKLMKALYAAQTPIGIDNLAIQLNENPKVVLETIEPYLIQKGLITRAAKGRSLTVEGLAYLFNHGHLEFDRDENGFYDVPMNS